MSAATTSSIETLFDDLGPVANSAPGAGSDDAGPIRVVRDGAASRPRQALFRTPIRHFGHASVFFGFVLLDIVDEWVFGNRDDDGYLR